MLKHIGNKPINVEKFISEIYKLNIKQVSKAIADERNKEVTACQQETAAIINTYQQFLDNAITTVIESVLNDIEKILSQSVPSFKNNATFLMDLIEYEIKTELPIGFNVDFTEVSMTTGTYEHYESFKDILNVNFDESLGEELIIFTYKDVIKTLNFQSLSSNLVRDLRECRKKYLNTLGLGRMKN